MSENKENNEMLEQGNDNDKELEVVLTDDADIEGVFDQPDSSEESEDMLDETSSKKPNKQKNPRNPGKMRNQNFFRRGSYSLIMVAIVLAVLVLANVVTTLIAQKVPSTIDVTTEHSNKLSKENIDYIKKVNENVTIVVCATREGYTGGAMGSNAAYYYGVQSTSDTDRYYDQTITILEQYPKFNSHFKVKYVDPQKPSDIALVESSSDQTISYGDVVIQCTKKVNGKDTKLSEVIKYNDIYEINQGSDQYSGSQSAATIAANNIESKLTGAIYKLAVNDPKSIKFLSGYSDSASFQTLATALDAYNYQISSLDGAVTESSLKNVDMIIISKPTNDLSAAELNVIDKFLDNGGKKGKSLLFFGSESSPNLPNLYEFLDEWGIEVKDGMSYETESAYRGIVETEIRLTNKQTDITKSVNNSEKLYYCDSNLPLAQSFETSGTKTATVLMTTSTYAVIAPKGTVSGYKPPSNAKKQAIPTAIMTKDVISATTEGAKDLTSTVTAFSSSDFIADRSSYTAIGNMEFAVTVVNAAVGRDNTDMYFLPKITDITSMTTSQALKWFILFATVIVIPVSILIGGVFTWIRRRKR